LAVHRRNPVANAAGHCGVFEDQQSGKLNMRISCPTLLVALLLASLVVATPTLHAQSSSPPLEAFGNLPTLEDVVVSPDGSRLAFVRTEGENRIVVAKQIAGAQTLGGVKVGDVKLRSLVWIDNDNLLITVSNTSALPIGYVGPITEWFRPITLELKGGRTHPLDLSVSGERVFNVLSGPPVVRSVEGKSVLFVPGLYVSGHVLPALFSVTLPDLRARLLDKAAVPQTNWLINESGQIAAHFSYFSDKKTWQISARKNDRMTPISTGTAEIDIPSILGFSADGSSIITRFIKNGEAVWMPLSIQTGTWGAPLSRGESFSRFFADRLSGRILGGAHGLDDEHYVFFDNEKQAQWNAVLRAFPDERVRLASHSDDFSKMVLQVFGQRDGYSYAFFDWYSHTATVLEPVYAGMKTPAEIKPFSYHAADGMTIPGFLTLPRGVEPRNLPLVVFPHGGPAAADTLQFDWWAQAMAAQGYAVLQPNYRGSTVTLGHLEAGFGEWGRKMQTDLSDGVRDLAKQGVIDPKRVCIVGASYGGYAALAGVTLDPGIYRCAVSVAGLSDLRRFLEWTADTKVSHSERYWDRFMGVTDKKGASLVEISPIEHIAAVTVPVLLIHGRDDTVVPYEQSDVMYRALKKAGKPVELVTLKHEDHWLSTGATRLQMLQAMVAFLQANNPPN
jgi:cephalosporin-C deacetylase-like acetyl esterase